MEILLGGHGLGSRTLEIIALDASCGFLFSVAWPTSSLSILNSRTTIKDGHFSHRVTRCNRMKEDAPWIENTHTKAEKAKNLLVADTWNTV